MRLILFANPARRVQTAAIAIALTSALASPARADGDRLLSDDTFAVDSNGGLVVDGGLRVGRPAALTTGMSTGFAAGITRECSCWWSYGARASWSTDTEASTNWTVSQSDYRLRATAALLHRTGRGTWSLRLGVGPTFVHEVRVENLGMLAGNAHETRAIATLPAADLDAVVSLHITGPWLMVISGGPTLDVHDGGVHGGWNAELAVGWQP